MSDGKKLSEGTKTAIKGSVGVVLLILSALLGAKVGPALDGTKAACEAVLEHGEQ